jgi:predicted transporter
MTKEQLNTALTGSIGLNASGVVEHVALPSVEQIESGAGLVTQLLILIVTIVGIFKRRKPQTNKNPK